MPDFSIPYFDLHCDTAYEMYVQKKGLKNRSLAISQHQADVFPHYAQCFAVWSDCRLSAEDAYCQFLRIAEYFSSMLQRAEHAKRLSLARTGDDIVHAWSTGRHAALLAVEDARILNGKLDRLQMLKKHGVVYLTLLWGGSHCIGGSHDTCEGLTDFGKDVVRECFRLGIVPDISHASEQSAEQILDLATQANTPVIATHSNAYSVYSHSRNLRDEHFRQIKALGGVVGLNLYAHHIADPTVRQATVDDLLAHLEHYLALGGEDTVAVGGDLDGAYPLPQGINRLSDLTVLPDRMAAKGLSSAIIEKVYYKNALNFATKHFCG